MARSKLAIKISADEMTAMHNAEFYILKHSLTKKLYHLFADLKEKISEQPKFEKFPFPEGTDYKTGKITKGENYRQLPFVILDFPRLFQKPDVFSYRSMFWWGNYFLFTLHLSGGIKKKYEKNILDNFTSLEQEEYHIGLQEWEHSLETFIPVNRKNKTCIDKQIREAEFIKLTKKLELTNWEKVPQAGAENFKLLLKILQ